MYKVLYRSIRQHTGIDFFSLTDKYKILVKQELDSGRLLKETVELVDNDLVQRHELIWDSFESLQSFNKNFTVTEFYKQRIEYSNKNDISLNIISEVYYE